MCSYVEMNDETTLEWQDTSIEWCEAMSESI